MPDWRCPSCLGICNCSGRTCDRHNAGLGCTRILSAEAREQGYRSVRRLSRFRPAVQLPRHTALRPGMGKNGPLVDDCRTEGLSTCQFQIQINHHHPVDDFLSLTDVPHLPATPLVLCTQIHLLALDPNAINLGSPVELGCKQLGHSQGWIRRRFPCADSALFDPDTPRSEAGNRALRDGCTLPHQRAAQKGIGRSRRS